MKPDTLAKIAVAYSGFVWGLFWIPVRALDAAGVNGLWGLLVFYLVPGLLILPVLAVRWRQTLRGGWWLLLIGLATSVPLVCYSLAVLYTDVIRAMLLFYLTPVWSTVLGWHVSEGTDHAGALHRHCACHTRHNGDLRHR